MYTDEELKTLKVAKVKIMGSLMFHTRYFYKKMFKRKFVVNRHHEIIAGVFELVLQGKLVNVIINIAPRYSKTEIAVKNFISHALALTASARFIHLSFSDSLALDNSDGVKDILKTEDYQFMFPNVTIKSGTDSKKKWYTTEGGGVYATSTAGQVTGFGAGKVDEEKQNEEVDPELEEELDSFFSSMEAKEGFGGALIIDDPINFIVLLEAIISASFDFGFSKIAKCFLYRSIISRSSFSDCSILYSRIELVLALNSLT